MRVGGEVELSRGIPGVAQRSEVTSTQTKTQASTWGLATKFILLQIAPNPWGCFSGGDPHSPT